MEPYYEHAGITIFHGDCLEVMPTLDAGTFDAVICDPPYGTTACAWDSPIPFEPMWAALRRLTRPRAAIVLFGSQPFTSALVMSNVKWFRYEWVWDKAQVSGFLNAKKQPMKVHESVLVFSEQPHMYNPQMEAATLSRATAGNNAVSKNYGTYIKVAYVSDKRYPKSIVHFSQGRSPFTRTIHSTQKPITLMEYLVRTYTNEGDTVLDFTMGSGTTGEACVNTVRDFIGIEKDQAYYDIATRRLEAAAARMIQTTLEGVA